MADEITRITGNIFKSAQVGNVEKVKEVTPRPEEGGNKSSPFNKVNLGDSKDEGKGYDPKKKKFSDKEEDKETIETGDDEENLINIIV